jgi:hypothetical protein
MSQTKHLLYEQIVDSKLHILSESDWNTCSDWWRMICHLHSRKDSAHYNRKVHLFTVESCHIISKSKISLFFYLLWLI